MLYLNLVEVVQLKLKVIDGEVEGEEGLQISLQKLNFENGIIDQGLQLEEELRVQPLHHQHLDGLK